MNKFNFTDEQQIAYDKILSYLDDPLNPFFLLEGYAGTGKTYLITKVVNELIKTTKFNIAVTAPTHKAVRVLVSESGFTPNNKLSFSTVHSILGLKEEIDGFGVQHFVPNKNEPAKLQDYQILVIDESSMFSDDLFYYLLPYIDKGLKVIFVGDPAQIPPVNKMDSIPFLVEEQRKHNIQISRLKNIVRQAQDNPIIQTTFAIREDLLNGNITTKLFEKTHNNIGCRLYRNMHTDDEDKIIYLIYDYFISNEFKKDPDYAKIIAWRNETVNSYNDLIRTMIYGEDPKKIMVGEKLIVDATITDDYDQVIFNTNDELMVLDTNVKYEFINNGKDKLYYYETDVESTDFYGKLIRNQIKILHENSEVLYQKTLSNLKQNAQNFRQGSDRAKMEWIKFFMFKNSFANVKYNYCITAHKSQGSTYKNTIVHAWDILYNPKIEERNRILYTACSRPKYNLHIIK